MPTFRFSILPVPLSPQAIIGRVVEVFPQQGLWSLALVSQSNVAARQKAATGIINAAVAKSVEMSCALYKNFSQLVVRLIEVCRWKQPEGRARVRGECVGGRLGLGFGREFRVLADIVV